MEKINIAEILRNCPRDMELNCTMYDNLYFNQICDDDSCLYKINCYTIANGIMTAVNFTEFGTFNIHTNSKCVIFPKGKTTWEGFVPPCKFKDGDVVAAVTANGESCQLFLLKHLKYHIKNNGYDGYCYFGWNFYDNMLFEEGNWGFNRLATEEEKEKLFQAIKDNGYRWNHETKILERIEPKFKDGDIAITDKGDIHLLRTKDSSYCAYRERWDGLPKFDKAITTSVRVVRLATEEEKQKLFKAIKDNGYRWDEETKTLVKLIEKPNFKVGDKIVKKNSACAPMLITTVSNEFYYSNTESSVGALAISEQDNYELVPDKFDINTLTPFESKILVRSYTDDLWKPAIFGFYLKDKPYCYCSQGGTYWKYCIPYEGNEHLLGTTNDCINYYKTWK